MRSRSRAGFKSIGRMSFPKPPPPLRPLLQGTDRDLIVRRLWSRGGRALEHVWVCAVRVNSNNVPRSLSAGEPGVIVKV